MSLWICQHCKSKQASLIVEKAIKLFLGQIYSSLSNRDASRSLLLHWLIPKSNFLKMFAASFAFHLWHCFNQLVLFDQWETQFSIISEAINEPVLTRVNPPPPPKKTLVLTSSESFACWCVQWHIVYEGVSHTLVIFWQAVSADPGWQSKPLNCIACCCWEMRQKCQCSSGGALGGGLCEERQLLLRLQVVSVLPNTQTLSPETLYLLQFQSSRELQAREPTGGGQRGPRSPWYNCYPPTTGPPFSGIFKLE